MNTTKISSKGKILLFVLIAVITLGGAWFVKDLPMFKDITKGKVEVGAVGSTNNGTAGEVATNNKESVMRISLDEWIGWKPILDANGGLKTAKGSIYDKLGLKLEISIINDGAMSSNAVISNNLDGAGYTINRYAFLYSKFMDAKVPVRMPYITNASAGGDGIIVKSEIKSVEQLVGKKIAVPRFSEAQTLVEWLLANSSLTDKQVTDIRKNMVYFDTPDDAAKAFFAGKVDGAATWQPYLSQAQETSNARILFSTKSATNLIIDGIMFRKDYMDDNKDKVSKFIEGALKAEAMYTTEFAPIKDSMPLFATESNENIKAMSGDAVLSDYTQNMRLMKGVNQTLFKDMSNIWLALGEKAMPEEAITAFDSSIIEPLADKFPTVTTAPIKFTEKQRVQAKATPNNESLMKQSLSVTFNVNSTTIKSESYEALNKFAETAQLLNGVIIQIEGNTDSAGDANKNLVLSEARAKSVMTYLKYQGLDVTRMIVIGNGENKPVADNKTDAGKAANRRTDIYFKVIQ